MHLDFAVLCEILTSKMEKKKKSRMVSSTHEKIHWKFKEWAELMQILSSRACFVFFEQNRTAVSF